MQEVVPMFKLIIAAVFGLFASVSAMAAPVVLTSLTDSIDFTTTSTAILSAAAALMVVYITWKAAKLVIGAVKGL